MAAVAIRETTVTPGADGLVVRLHISDVPPPYEDASTLLQINVQLPNYQPPPLLAQLQIEAIYMARETLTELLGELGLLQFPPGYSKRPGNQP